MRYSDRSPSESDGFSCPTCGNAVQFGEDSAKLEHVDGSPMCALGEEPEHTTPAAQFGPISAPVMPGPGTVAPDEEADVPDYLLASAQRSQERAARLAVATSRWEQLSPYGTGKRGGIGWGVLGLFLCLALAVAGCFWFAIANWPQP